MHMHTPYSGSYAPGDIDFILKAVSMAPTAVAEKEAAIQSGKKHYSEMISEEARPDARYMALYEDALARGAARMAEDLNGIALTIYNSTRNGDLPSQISLCSLVRAGAPYGVLLFRALKQLGADVRHYGVSIIRDFGLDANAMELITRDRPEHGVLFVDGWTGKGAISKELHESWRDLSGLKPRLIVLADPCGRADLSGSHEDWLIPSGILGANVSGLISRSIRNNDLLKPNDFHGFIPVSHLTDIDQTQSFIETIWALMLPKLSAGQIEAREWLDPDAAVQMREASSELVQRLMSDHSITSSNRVKPGIAEATRAVLRRMPEHVYVRCEDDLDVAALLHLCKSGGVAWSADPEKTGPYRAVTIISKS